MATFNSYIHRLLNMPLTNRARHEEWNTILAIAETNGYQPHIVYDLKARLMNKVHKQRHENTDTLTHKRWTVFTYFSPLIRRVTNIFKHTGLKIIFRTINTLQQQLSEKPKQQNPSGIYRLKCITCNLFYIGQSGRAIDVRFKGHLRYIRTNNPTYAYATHILHNIHEYGTINDTLHLLKPCRKGTQMNCWESLYIQTHHQHIVSYSFQNSLSARLTLSSS
jgi:hypothetical protein